MALCVGMLSVMVSRTYSIVQDTEKDVVVIMVGNIQRRFCVVSWKNVVGPADS
jgi:hypothetical protein